MSVECELPAHARSSSPAGQDVQQGGFAGTRGAQNGKQTALGAAVALSICSVCCTGDAGHTCQNLQPLPTSLSEQAKAIT